MVDTITTIEDVLRVTLTLALHFKTLPVTLSSGILDELMNGADSIAIQSWNHEDHSVS